MSTVEIILLVSLGVLFYTYVGYGLLVGFLASFRKPSSPPILTDFELPAVTHVIAAYNEEDIILDKIRNCKELDYPEGKVKTIIVADGSSDKTPDLVYGVDGVQLYYRPARRGKLAAVNRVMDDVDTPITIFSDANTMLTKNSIKEMVRHFSNEQVGGVAGEKVVLNAEEDDAAAAGEGLYWKYESLLKKLDYRLHSVVGAAGELFALRTDLYEEPDSDTLIEDFILTLNVAKKGYRVAYEPNAKAMEYASASTEEELKRKVRISAGGLQAIWKLRGLLNPFKYGVLNFQYVSHRVLRWSLAPLSIVALFFSSMSLAIEGLWYYDLLFAGEIMFYAAAVAGYLFEKTKTRLKALFVPFYFMFMNISVFMGLFKLLQGDYSVNWEKAKRR